MLGPVTIPASRTEAVLEAIRRAILTRELRPGQALVEMELAQRLGVSKTPVREALRLLSGSGLVTFGLYKGAKVSVVDAAMARHVYDIRSLLEPEAVRRAVLAGGPHLDDAAEALHSAERALADGDRAELSMLNREFHRALYRGCGNPLLISTLDDLRDLAALISVTGWAANPSAEQEQREHAEILRAATSGDADRAADLLRLHIAGFLERVLAVLAD